MLQIKVSSEAYNGRLERIVDLRTGELIGCELLQGEFKSDASTVPEWQDWYDRVSDWMFDEGASLPYLLFMNVHSDQFLDNRIAAHLERLSVFKTKIVLEWTEKASLPEDFDLKVLEQKVLAFREMGFAFAIDDVGAYGLDPLWRIATSNPYYVKVSGPYFQKCLETPDGRDSLSMIASMALDGSVRRIPIVEWIETSRQFDLATQLGFVGGQGYYFEKQVER